MPEQLAQWFAGEIKDTLYVLLPYEQELLPSRWRAWKLEHPQAKPPDGFAWLDDEFDELQPTAEEVREARKMLARDR